MSDVSAPALEIISLPETEQEVPAVLPKSKMRSRQTAKLQAEKDAVSRDPFREVFTRFTLKMDEMAQNLFMLNEATVLGINEVAHLRAEMAAFLKDMQTLFVQTEEARANERAEIFRELSAIREMYEEQLSHSGNSIPKEVTEVLEEYVQRVDESNGMLDQKLDSAQALLSKLLEERKPTR